MEAHKFEHNPLLIDTDLVTFCEQHCALPRASTHDCDGQQQRSHLRLVLASTHYAAMHPCAHQHHIRIRFGTEASAELVDSAISCSCRSRATAFSARLTSLGSRSMKRASLHAFQKPTQHCGQTALSTT
eukprot:4110122-Amphidinium_carterae.1